jgi:hypothetical protein
MINSKVEKSARIGVNLGFSAFLLALFGWINLETLMAMNDGGVHGQLFAGGVALYLSITAYRRYQTWRVSMPPPTSEFAQKKTSKASPIVSGIMLIATGFATACSMRTGLAITAAMGASVLLFIPWSRIRLCREHFFISQALSVAGGLPVLIFAAKNQHPIIQLVNSWTFWAVSASLLLATLWRPRLAVPHLDPLSRQVESKAYESSGQ